MAIVTAYDRMGYGLNMVDTKSSFIPNSNNLIPDGDPVVNQFDSDTYAVSTSYNGGQTILVIFISQYSGNIWTLESLYAYDSEVEPLLGAYGVNIRIDVTDDFSAGAYLTNLYSGNDVMSGNKYADIIKSGIGNDDLQGNAGNDKLYGEAGNDTLGGGAGNDTLDGGAGNDALIGGAGNDTYIVDSTLDVITEGSNAGTDTVKTTLSKYSLAKLANVENLTYTGKAASTLTGNTTANTLTGGAGNDTLNGAAGNDILYGGSGADKFVFDTTLSASTNLDTIKDFVKGTDKIVLDDDIFTKFLNKSSISAGNLITGTKALQKDDYLIYNTSNDTLYYDADGSGSKFGLIAFTKIELVGTAAPLATDFLVIA
jgi:Ca2+-binding RTX toxin-like protein